MGFCFCSDLLFIGGGDREPQSFQSPGAPPAKNGSQSSSARCAGVLPYSSSTAMQSMARVVPSSNRASTRLVSILKQQESSLFIVNLTSISNGVCSDVLNPAKEPVCHVRLLSGRNWKFLRFQCPKKSSRKAVDFEVVLPG